MNDEQITQDSHAATQAYLERCRREPVTKASRDLWSRYVTWAGSFSGRLDPLDALTLSEHIASAIAGHMRALVTEARHSEHTWQEIGDAIGSTRQAVYQRYH